MINHLAKLLSGASNGRMDALSRQVADLSLDSVCEVVGDRIECMTFSEARGYVRARASRVVRKQARMAISRHPGADQTWLDAITRSATERIVPLVLRQTGVGVPKPAAPARMAA
ncbi:MAG: hypothetical protein ACR2NM_15190 [Bythopirellula sp.]